MATTQYVRYPTTTTVSSSAATGTIGAAAPTSADQIGARDGSGNLQNLTVDASKNLNVNVQAGTLTALNPSVSTTGSVVPADATFVGMSVAGSLTGLTGTANGLKVDGSAVTQPVSAASLPLPSGASTSALQTTGNTSLSSIDGKLASLGQKTMVGSEPVVIASDQSAIPVTQSGTWNVNNISGTVSLPTGAATAANQSTANTTLSSINNGVAALGFPIGTPGSAVPSNATLIGVQKGLNIVALTEGQTTAAGSLPVVLASDQSAVPTKAPVNSNGSFGGASISAVTTVSVPANAVGFVLEADSANTDFMRWCDSNTSASATVGMKLEAGRDTGYIPMAHSISICPNSGSQAYSIQWVLSS